jgi:hypothetical protein
MRRLAVIDILLAIFAVVYLILNPHEAVEVFKSTIGELLDIAVAVGHFLVYLVSMPFR